MDDIKKGTKVYWARILPDIQTYDLYDLTVRAVYDTYFVATDKKSKQAFPFNYSDIGEIVYLNRGEALEYLKNEELKAV